MRRCPECGRDQPLERDFCDCGEYLRWELTGATPVLGAGSPPPVLRATSPPGATPVMTRAASPAAVVLALLSGSGEWLAAPSLHVAPGACATLAVRVRNQRGIVDRFSIGVEGIPAEWWSAEPPTLHLNPWGSGGTCEGDVTVTLQPPRMPEAEARAWPLRIVARSGNTGTELARVPATLIVGRYDELELTLAPERRRARRRANYRVRVRNAGNARTTVTLTARDEEERCRCRLAGAEIVLAPGAIAERTLTARPRRPLLLGRPVEHGLALEAGAPSGPAASRRASYVQRAWLPRWLPFALPPAALLVAAALTLPVRVPDVRGVPLQDAQATLDASHLGFRPPELRPSRGRPGTVLGTIPAPGAFRLRGARVMLIVAAGSGRAKVPNVRGTSYEDALVQLVNAGFDTGPPPGKLDAKVQDQLPKPGTSWPRGREVRLVFEAPKRRPPRKVRVPAVAGRSLARAQAALTAAGLVPRVARAIDVEPAGTVLSATPSRGALPPGAKVELRVSAGFPQVAYDDGRQILLADGRDGSATRRLRLAGGGSQTQPAWTPDGRRLAYRSGDDETGRIWLTAAAADPRGGRPLTDGGHDDRRPAVSPDGTLVAFARGSSRGATHRICVVRLAGSAVHCASAAAGLSRPVWSPDGSALLALADDGRIARLVRRPGSLRLQVAGLLALDRLGTVVSFAWSSHGALALAILPVRSGGPTLYSSAAEGASFGAPRALPFAGVACEVGWRSDGGELIVAGRRNQEGEACPDGPGADASASRGPADGKQAVMLAGAITDPAFRPLTPER